MKWLQDNPLGVVLAGCSGALLLASLLMFIVWALPVSVGTVSIETLQAASDISRTTARELGKIEEYQVIIKKPVFSETRQPLIAEVEDDEAQPADDSIAVAGVPDVRLTGVIITPALRIASLTPTIAGQESVMAHEGQSLTGEYVGWQVALVKPRNVILESSDGQSLKLELQVNDQKIIEPPRPVAMGHAKPAKPGKVADAGNEAGAPLSRAEKIRQKIAERREELRRQQDTQRRQGKPRRTASARKTAKPSPYQNAINAMMNRNRKDKTSNDKKDR